jgi:FtsZ-binding cell division protein ZapB
MFKFNNKNKLITNLYDKIQFLVEDMTYLSNQIRELKYSNKLCNSNLIILKNNNKQVIENINNLEDINTNLKNINENLITENNNLKVTNYNLNKYINNLLEEIDDLKIK